MATKTANVTVRIQPDIKESAEAILEKLGIPVSVFIDMTYRQVIANNGIPFALNLPKTIETRDELNNIAQKSIPGFCVFLTLCKKKTVGAELKKFQTNGF